MVVLIILLLMVAAFCGYKIYSIANQYHIQKEAYDAISETYAKKVSLETGVAATIPPVEENNGKSILNESSPIEIDFDSLVEELGDDVCGWLYIHYDDLREISYPIMHHDSNSYYLNHNSRGVASAGGAIFIDAANFPDFSDTNTIIHGHHMNDGSMFGNIDKWRKQEFFDAHPYYYINTPEGNYKVRVIAFFDTPPTSRGYEIEFYNDDEVKEWGDWVMATAISKDSTYEYTPGDKFVSLSTCTYTMNNGRGLLIGQMIPISG